MKWKEVISEADGIFSWRKALTALAALLFAASCVIYWLGGKELPDSYILIISGVFGSYFFRHRMSGLSNTFTPKYNGNGNDSGDNGDGEDNGNGNGNGHGNVVPQQPQQPQQNGNVDISGA